MIQLIVKISIIFYFFLFLFSCNNKESANMVHDLQYMVVVDSSSPDSAVSLSKGVTIKGLKEGLWITTNNKGMLTGECVYYHNIPNGKFRIYNENGRIIIDGFFRENIPTGIWTYYYENGLVQMIGERKGSMKIGTWKYFTNKGELDKEFFYEKSNYKIIKDNKLTPGPPPPD